MCSVSMATGYQGYNVFRQHGQSTPGTHPVFMCSIIMVRAHLGHNVFRQHDYSRPGTQCVPSAWLEHTWDTICSVSMVTARPGPQCVPSAWLQQTWDTMCSVSMVTARPGTHPTSMCSVTISTEIFEKNQLSVFRQDGRRTVYYSIF
jgi:hypothetical protein